MKKFLFFFLMTTACWAQSIGQYQYVIVPRKFDAQKKEDQFGLNELTKLFLEKNGYKVFFDSDILPPEVSGESCNKIYANVFSDNTLRKTKLRVEIKDCRNAVLFVSSYGESDEKDNRVAYNVALRQAFKSFDKPEYRYNPSPAVTQVSVAQPAKSTQKSEPIPDVVESAPVTAEVWSAQAIANGYQLVDTTPKIVWRIWKTSMPEVYIAQGENKNGVLFKSDGQWTLEYYAGGVKVVERPNIKF